MSMRIAPFVLIPVIAAAGGLALLGSRREPTATASPPELPPPGAIAPIRGDLPLGNDRALPPNHPPIGGGASPHGGSPVPSDEAPALAWTMPADWQNAPNPNAMRLATFHAPGNVEISVARAGGDAEANIQRWIGQFDDVGKETRAESTVRGLRVVRVEIAGTYVGGGMAMGGPSEPRSGWAMLAAIVATSGSSYFFKMLGPADAVKAAHPSFDALVSSITPR